MRPRLTGLLPLALLPLAVVLPLHAGWRVPPIASYTIEVTLDADHRLTGREHVTFVNRTGFAFEDLKLHLYLNAFRNDRSTWLREEAEGRGTAHMRDEEVWFGSSDINRLVLADGTDLTPRIRFIAPDDGNADDRTLVAVPLPQPVAPGQTLEFDLDFRAKLPRAIARTGWKDDFILAGQWFPKLCKATESGWNAHQFHAFTEFFADFGDYDVTLTLPAELKGKVGATGVPKEQTDVPGGLVRMHFVAEDVHDFAWTACPRFEVVRDAFSYPGLPNVEIVLLLQPDHRRVRDRYLDAVKQGLRRYGTWFTPYPYSVITVVDPPWGSAAGGMEYPTFFTGGAPWLAPRGVFSPEGVTIHEFGHQIFYGLLASNEFEEAHLDEGFNTYATNRALKDAYGDPVFEKKLFGIPFAFRSVRVPLPLGGNERYLDWQVASRSDPTTQPSFRDLDGGAVRANAYSKTALLLASCERTLGKETWDKVLKTYATRFAFKHPTTEDFLQVAREVAGPEAEKLLRKTWGTTNTLDYAVSIAETRRIAPPVGYVGDGAEMRFSTRTEPTRPTRWESTVVVRRMGEACWPVDVELRFEGGHTVRRTWDGTERWIRYRATGPKLLSATVDPDGKLLLDVNVLNNGRRTEPDRTATRRWGHRLRFWAQNVLELFALLAFVGGPA